MNFQDHEQLLIDSYWNLRKLSVVDYDDGTTEPPLGIVFTDTYYLVSNLETFHTYLASGWFQSEIEKKKFFVKYIRPFMYTHKICDKLNFEAMPTKNIRKFAYLYAVVCPGIDSFAKRCKTFGLKPPVNFDYNCSRGWLTYPGNIKALKRDLLIVDRQMAVKGGLR